jgi:WD40 repeat protein
MGLLPRVERPSIPDDGQENNEALRSLIREELLGYSPGRKTKSGDMAEDLRLNAPNVLKFRPSSHGSDPDVLGPPPHARASLTGSGPRAAVADRHWGELGSDYVRKIKKTPYKVLDAPGLKDDFYLNLIDWSQRNVLAVGLGSRVYLWSAATAKVTNQYSSPR